jgi:hypothetical protein
MMHPLQHKQICDLTSPASTSLGSPLSQPQLCRCLLLTTSNPNKAEDVIPGVQGQRRARGGPGEATGECPAGFMITDCVCWARFLPSRCLGFLA